MSDNGQSARGQRAARQSAGVGDERRPTSARDVEKAILFRIASGSYAPTDRLPTCEQLGAELGVNKNTVSKAFRALASRGYLQTIAGRGTFVAKRHARIDSATATAEVSRLLALAAQEAKLGGLDRQQFQEMVDETSGRAFGQTSARVGFVECNRRDAVTLSRELQAAISHPVEPVLLDEIAADPEQCATTYDILAVNLSHLLALEDGLRPASQAERPEVVGLLIPPDPESLIQVARLPAGTRLGIVCDLPGTLSALSGMVSSINHSIEIVSGLSDDEPALREVARKAGAILVTSSARDRLAALEPRVPLIEVTFRVDERSVQQLAEQVRERLRIAVGA